MVETMWVNLLGGPGCGKSTMMADIFSQLKWMGIDAEMAPEYAKELVWEGADGSDLSKIQVEIYEGQKKKIDRLEGKVEVAITDSPLILSLMYNRNLTTKGRLAIIKAHKSHEGMNVFVERHKGYNPNGRTQTELGARALDTELHTILQGENIHLEHVSGTHEGAELVVEYVLEALGLEDNSYEID